MQTLDRVLDFILIGVLTAIMWFICMLLSGVFKLCWACHQCILSIYCTCCKWNRDDAAFSKGSEKRCVYY